MDIKFRTRGKWDILDVAGHIRGGEVSQFRDAVKQAIDDKKLFLAADLREVGFIDSSGVGALISCHQDVKAAGGNLVLMRLSEDIYDLFEMTSIDRLFEIVDTEEELAA